MTDFILEAKTALQEAHDETVPEHALAHAAMSQAHSSVAIAEELKAIRQTMEQTEEREYKQMMEGE